MQEKNELQGLNDRLANYIEKVRHLEVENSRLSYQIQTSQETVTREVVSIKTLYEKELSDARRLLDETAKDKARLQIESNKLQVDNEDLNVKYAFVLIYTMLLFLFYFILSTCQTKLVNNYVKQY